MAEPVDLEEAGEILPLHADEGPIGFQPYVLDLQGMGHGSATVQKCLAIAVMVREDGLLLALPELALLGEVLGAGMQAGPLELIGPHTRVEVPAASMDEVAINADPVVSENQAVTAIVVDFSAGVLPFLKAADNEDLIDIMAFDVLDSLLVPSPADLVQKALGLGTEHGVFRQASVLLCGRGRGSSTALKPQTKASNPTKSHSKWWATRRRTFRLGSKTEADCCKLGRELGGDCKGAPFSDHTASRFDRAHNCDRSPHEQATRQNISIEKASWQLQYRWIRQSLSPVELVASMPPPKGISPQAKHRVSFGPQETAEISEEFAGREVRPCSGDDCSESGAYSFGCPDRQQLWRPPPGLECSGLDAFQSGITRQSEAPERIGSPQRCLFPKRFAEHVTTDVPYTACGSGDVSPAIQRGLSFSLSGEIWRLRQDPGLGIHHLAGGSMHELPPGGQCACSEGCHQPPFCLPGTVSDGWRQDGCGAAVGFGGRPSPDVIYGEVFAAGSTPRPFAPTANQKWVTTALQYLKELDTISTRRAEATSNKSGPSETAGSNPSPESPPQSKEGSGEKCGQSKGRRQPAPGGGDVSTEHGGR